MPNSITRLLGLFAFLSAAMASTYAQTDTPESAIQPAASIQQSSQQSSTPQSQLRRTLQGLQIQQRIQTGSQRIPPTAINAAYGGLLEGSAKLYFRAGDVSFDAKDWLETTDTNLKRTFYWNIDDAAKATGVVWQVSTRPFAPTLSISANPLEPKGLVRSGTVIAKSGVFTVDFAQIAVEQGLRRRTTATSEKPSIILRNNEIKRVAPITSPKTAKPGSRRNLQKATPQPRGVFSMTRQITQATPLNYIERGGTATFYIRALPVNGNLRYPKVIGFPSPIGEIKYGNRPQLENPFNGFEWRQKEIPQISLTAFSYTPFWADTRWPEGCKVFRGGNDEWNPLEFLLDAWDWGADTFADIKSYVVDVAQGLLPFVPRTVFELALDGALMAAGIPPTLPNIDQLMEEGAGYLAAQVAAEVAGPIGSELTDQIAGELFEDAAASMIADLSAEELNARVQDELQSQLKGQIQNSARSARTKLENNAEDNYCQTREYVPTIRLTIKNMTDKRYADVPITIKDETGIFEAHTPSITLRPNESYDLIFPMYPDFWKIAARSNIALYQARNKYWNEYYLTPTRFVVEGPNTSECFESDYGFAMQCNKAPAGDQRPLRFQSRRLILSEDFKL